MNLASRTSEGTHIVDVTGDVDLKGSPQLRKVLFEALKESQRLKRQLVLFGMNARVNAVFKLTHVMQIFQVVDTEEQALAAGNSRTGFGD